jgi:hypothetical protein
MICYKIRSKANPELFVAGTPSYNSYEKTGRIFQTLGKLRSFLTVVMNSEHRSSKISEWEVVEVEMVVKEVKAIHEVLTAKKLKN